MSGSISCPWASRAVQGCICLHPARFARITAHRARLLTLIADYETNDAIALTLGISVATVKREVEDLRHITGCRSKRDLARWWNGHRKSWRALWNRNESATDNGLIGTMTGGAVSET
jgi:DNA-binding CsgD family transcriptional regulator